MPRPGWALAALGWKFEACQNATKTSATRTGQIYPSVDPYRDPYLNSGGVPGSEPSNIAEQVGIQEYEYEIPRLINRPANISPQQKGGPRSTNFAEDLASEAHLNYLVVVVELVLALPIGYVISTTPMSPRNAMAVIQPQMRAECVYRCLFREFTFRGELPANFAYR